MGRTPQPKTEYARYAAGASDGVRVAVSLRRARAAAPNALTAEFQGLPAAHDGSRAFTFRSRGSASGSPGSATRPAVAGSRRGGGGHGRHRGDGKAGSSSGPATSDLWQVTVEPDSTADVTSPRSRPATTACNATPAAVCTSDGRALSTTISATVAGARVRQTPMLPKEVRRGTVVEQPRHGSGRTQLVFPVNASDGRSAHGPGTPQPGGGGAGRAVCVPDRGQRPCRCGPDAGRPRAGNRVRRRVVPGRCRRAAGPCGVRPRDASPGWPWRWIRTAGS